MVENNEKGLVIGKVDLTDENRAGIFQAVILLHSRDTKLQVMKHIGVRHFKTAEKIYEIIKKDWEEYNRVDVERAEEQKRKNAIKI